MRRDRAVAAGAGQQGPETRRTWRGLLRRLHLWTALVLCLPLVGLGLTGSLLVLRPELESVSGSALQASAGLPHAWSEIVAAAAAAAPSGSRPVMVMAPRTQNAPAMVRFATRKHGPAVPGIQIGVDPATLAVLGSADAGSGFLGRVFMLHANLLTSDRSGRQIVGWFGVAMLALGISGVVLWWPRRGSWRRAFTVRRGSRGRRLWRELHGAAGIWGVAVLLAVSFSGVCLAFPQSTAAGIGAVLPLHSPRATPAVAPIAGAKPLDIDAAVAVALRSVENGRLRFASYPAHPDQPYRVGVTRADDRPGAPFVEVLVDPWQQSAIAIRDPRNYSFGDSVLAWQHAIHAGSGLGIGWHIAVFAVGLLPAVLAATGIAMWLSDPLRERRLAPLDRAALAGPAE
ncbi:MAG: PepSY domain-containing protein [Alphaproteobacteria bacterium]|nr:PepSY domain-containing protein [Alphaproteobacteria bacterium]